jgi:UDP-galactopyranose mutase
MLTKSKVILNTDFFRHKEQLIRIASKIVFTGCIDAFFDYRLGRLEYRSLRFEQTRIETDNYQGNAVINYTERKIPYTRSIEHKHFEFGQQSFTVITHEYPETYSEQSEPYYPINDIPNMNRYNRYKELAAEYPNILFGGRLGQYSYFDMDDTIEAALLMVSDELRNV